MKPSIPDTGIIMKLEGDNAVIRMEGHESCWKCGAAAIGLCKAGMMQVLTVRNTKQARVGERLKIGLVQRVQYAGYVLAYVMPAAALILGAAAGHELGDLLGFATLDIIAGFGSMLAVSFFSFRRLKRLDSSHAIEIVQVITDPWVPGSPVRGDETLSDYYASYY